MSTSDPGHQVYVHGPLSTCDWGWCDEPSVALRYAPELKAWLPVCKAHADEAEGE